MEIGLNTMKKRGGRSCKYRSLSHTAPGRRNLLGMHVLTLECLVPDCLFAHNIKGHLELAMGGLKSPASWTEKGLIQRWSISQGCAFPGPSWWLSCKLKQRDNREMFQDGFGRAVCQGRWQTSLRKQMWVTLSPGRQCTVTLQLWSTGNGERKIKWLKLHSKLKYFYQKTLPHFVFPTYH